MTEKLVKKWEKKTFKVRIIYQFYWWRDSQNEKSEQKKIFNYDYVTAAYGWVRLG